MVSREIELSEQRLKTKEKQVKGKSINLMTLQTAIQEIEEFEMDCNHSWTTIIIRLSISLEKQIRYNHYKNVLKERRCILLLTEKTNPGTGRRDILTLESKITWTSL